MTPRELANRIRRLNARELAELNQLLRDEPGWDGTAGVREPRRPLLPSTSAPATAHIEWSTGTDTT